MSLSVPFCCNLSIISCIFLRFVSCLLSFSLRLLSYVVPVLLAMVHYIYIYTNTHLPNHNKHTHIIICDHVLHIFDDIANGFVNSNSEIDVNNVNNNQANEPQRKCVCVIVYQICISINISLHMHIQIYMYCVYVVCWLYIYIYILLYIQKKNYCLEIGVCTWFMFQRFRGSDLQNTHTYTNITKTHKLLTTHTNSYTHDHLIMNIQRECIPVLSSRCFSVTIC